MASRAHTATPLDVLLSSIPSLPRPMLARLVERAIEHLDAVDGDPDIEPEDDGDRSEDDFQPAWLRPGEDPLFGIYPTHPIYGADQSPGPLNEVAAHRAHMRRMLAG
jgi:hypothetical protein